MFLILLVSSLVSYHIYILSFIYFQDETVIKSSHNITTIPEKVINLKYVESSTDIFCEMYLVGFDNLLDYQGLAQK